MPDFLAGRATVASALKEELVGPCPRGTAIDCAGNVAFPDRESAYGPWRQAGSGEEILQRDRPIKRYGIGVLYPPMTAGDTDPGAETDTKDEPATIEEVPGDSQEILAERAADSIERIAERQRAGASEESDFDLSTANSYRPSAIGLSFVCQAPQGSRLCVTVEAGRYREKEVTIRTGKPADDASNSGGDDYQTRRWWLRSPVRIEAQFASEDLTAGDERAVSPVEQTENNLEGLDLSVTAFARPRGNGTSLVTVSLVNRTKAPRFVDVGCLFQVRSSAKVEGEGGGILPYEEGGARSEDEEEASLALLYRSLRTFAVGHGCAAGWSGETQDRAREVSAESLPTYEAPSTTPDIVDDQGNPITVPIAPLAGIVDGNDGLASIDALLRHYAEWIERQRARASQLDEEFQAAAARHVELAERVLSRMRSGLEQVRSDERVRRAFRLANHAMLLQQLRTRRRNPRETRYNGDSRRIEVVEPLDVPDERDLSNRADWRPFQIAFVLMALSSTASRESPERETVELIFFPTGGGKTEAYLCLAAFSMFYRRLTDPVDAGVDVLMRYTLRLLTAQQFQRAGALICAMEHLRARANDLGGERFTIGIWVGSGVTPNSRGRRAPSCETSSAETGQRTSSSCCAAPGARRRWERSRALAGGSATRPASRATKNATARSSCTARMRTASSATVFRFSSSMRTSTRIRRRSSSERSTSLRSSHGARKRGPCSVSRQMEAGARRPPTSSSRTSCT